MKTILRVLTVIFSALIILNIVGCKKSNDFVLSNDEYFAMENDVSDVEGSAEVINSKTQTGKSSNEKKTSSVTRKKKSSTASSTVNDGDDDYDDIELPVVEKEFIPTAIPSRANAYKLKNTYSKMKNGETVNVVYYGGSVTSGHGSSDADRLSWRALTTSYLKSVSLGKVNEINAAIGGTGSYLGAARFDHDVLLQKPDLLFIEFAINDSYNGYSQDLCKANLEYMINSLYSQYPYADIVIVLVTNEANFGSGYSSSRAHIQVADYYNIPIVDLGRELYNKIKGSKTELKKVFSDSVHPNDKGYKIYGDIMIGALKELLTDEARAAHTIPGKRLCENGYTTLENHFAADITASGWNCNSWFDSDDYEKKTSPFKHQLNKFYTKYLAPQNTGDTITFDFIGNSFGMLGTVKSGTWLQFTLDNGEYKFIKGNTDSSLIEFPLFENLSNTKHTVKVTVGASPPYITIAGFVTTKK